MRALAAGLLAGLVLLPAAPGRGQTPEIQKKIEKKLKQARAAEKKQAEARLERVLAEALKDNPDLRVAETKVRTAEAERDRFRLKLVQEVTVAHAERERAQAAVAVAQVKLDRARSLIGRGVAQEDLAEVGTALQQAKANLAVVEAKLNYLVGKRSAPDVARVASVNFELALRENDARLVRQAAAKALATMAPTKVEGTMAEKLRKALAVPITLDSRGGGLDFKEALDLVRQKLKGINVVCPQQLVGRTAVLRLTEAIPLGAALQLLEEEYKCRFVLRDYGIRVVDAQEQAPPGAVFVVDFWKQNRGADQHKQ
jgi:hypothetical protein